MSLVKVIYYIVLVFFLGCAGNVSIDASLKNKLDKAKALFEDEKYTKARDEFEYIIYNNPGSAVALTAQYYFAESLYMLENYDQASKEYDKFNMLSQNSELIARSKFLICKCLYMLSSKSNKDQSQTEFTIDRIQYFLEEYPNTGHKDECESMIVKLRTKLAKKEIDAGKLYLRIDKYDSALIYFNLVMIEYYDTIYFDEALINILLTHTLKGDLKIAEIFFNDNKNKFKSDDKLNKASQILKDSKEGSKMSKYYKFSK